MSAAIAPVPLRRSRWIPWIFVGGFALVVAVNGTMITFAIQSFTGLTTSEPYTKGLRFNDQLRQAHTQARLGWHLATRFESTGAQRGHLALSVVDRNGAPVSGAVVIAAFARPVERGHDFSLTLPSAGGGRHAADVRFPLTGAWDVRYRIEREGAVLEARERLDVK